MRKGKDKGNVYRNWLQLSIATGMTYSLMEVNLQSYFTFVTV